MGLIFIDCEAYGSCPALGQLTEFGAVDYMTGKKFHGIIVAGTKPSEDNPAVPEKCDKVHITKEIAVFTEFDKWIKSVSGGSRAIMVSDNPAFDFQWINDGFFRTLGYNPLGYSARRIGDFYAGLCNDFYASNRWKKLRVTKHDHNPVNDALGNVEAFRRILNGERP